MKLTIHLPEELLRRAEAIAAARKVPLESLIAEAVRHLVSTAPETPEIGRQSDDAFLARFVQLPDGTLFNPEGIDDESFFRALDEIRSGRSV